MIIPSIDLMNGRAVVLKQGKKKIFEEKDIDKLVRMFMVFPQVNVIDIDAVLTNGNNVELIKSLCKKLHCNVGGGIRSKEQAYEYLRAGAKNVIIGTCAEPGFLSQLPQHRVIVALDIKNGCLATKGWTKKEKVNLPDRIKALENHCRGFLITNIDVEGLGKGVDMSFIKNLSVLTKRRIMISGGITTYDEIRDINKMNFDLVLGLALHTGKIDINQAIVKLIDFTKGPVPTIVVNEANNLLMLAYSSEKSLLKSLEERIGCYYSRKRKSLWIKGETSGNRQSLISFSYDCDSDTLLFKVKQKGNACHLERYSCFGDRGFDINYLLAFLRERIKEKSCASYTTKISANKDKLCKKIIEEAFEVTTAKSDAEKIWELSDLLYFMLVYMAKNKIRMDDVLNELSVRHKHEI